jgi:hypothetical protein
MKCTCSKIKLSVTALKPTQEATIPCLLNEKLKIFTSVSRSFKSIDVLESFSVPVMYPIPDLTSLYDAAADRLMGLLSSPREDLAHVSRATPPPPSDSDKLMIASDQAQRQQRR